jgi:hypothetical protein
VQIILPMHKCVSFMVASIMCRESRSIYGDGYTVGKRCERNFYRTWMAEGLTDLFFISIDVLQFLDDYLYLYFLFFCQTYCGFKHLSYTEARRND